jgi:hypothetical protein
MTIAAKVSRAARNRLSQPIAIRLMPDELEKTEHYAKMDMRSRSLFIRVTFLQGLAIREKQIESTNT